MSLLEECVRDRSALYLSAYSHNIESPHRLPTNPLPVGRIHTWTGGAEPGIDELGVRNLYPSSIGAPGASRGPSIPAGRGILALVCASALFPYSLISTVAYAAVLPAAIAYALLSCRPTDPMISAVGLLIPTMLSVFTLSAPPDRPYEFGWTAGDDAAALVFDPGTVGSRAPVAVVVAIFTALIAAGIPAAQARRRQRSEVE